MPACMASVPGRSEDAGCGRRDRYEPVGGLRLRRLGVREYKSQVAAHPFVLFTASLVLWIMVFPAYLAIRSKIRDGQLPKAENTRERPLLYICIFIWCFPIVLTALAYFTARSFERIP